MLSIRIYPKLGAIQCTLIKALFNEQSWNKYAIDNSIFFDCDPNIFISKCIIVRKVQYIIITETNKREMLYTDM